MDFYVMPGYRYDQLSSQAGYDVLFRLKPPQDRVLTACAAYDHQEVVTAHHILSNQSCNMDVLFVIVLANGALLGKNKSITINVMSL